MDIGHRIGSLSRPPQEVVERLAQHDAADLGDVLRHSTTMFGLSALWAPVPRIAGPAVTLSVTVANIDMLRMALDRCQRGDVLVVNARGAMTTAMLGGYMSLALVNRGVAGVVVDGVVRDAHEMRRHGLPVWARGVTTNGAARTAPGEINHPTACGGAVVNPGDIVVADEGGVVAVPQSAAGKTLELAGELVQTHRSWDEEVSRGDIFGLADSRERVLASGISIAEEVSA